MTATSGLVPRLTAGQLEVFHMLAAGLTVSQIATRLCRAKSCVSMRIARACLALDARTTVQAVHIATRLGLLDVPASTGGTP